ncbi:polyamine-modulated factor 1-binding protein 1-like [Bombyx mandarina]|uniref:Polyamine-modulated factor 1-binding protein 1-like n=1 Tax=Bombyx mandarina TaxID=7092 RepID=A0A6J2K9C8_BOMMA|nr:polyamine-modulated factor 1-binding protein 1-like [Bombyx mandarina]
MNQNIIDCDAERDVCECKRGSTLAILREVQVVYEKRLARIEEAGAGNKTQMQVAVLKSWVSDLLAQNTLLVQAVEDLETEATSKLLYERRKHVERYKKQPSCNNATDLKGSNERLQNEVFAKEREIQKLNKDIQQCEEKISNLRNELSVSQYRVPEIPKKDAEVMAQMCYIGTDDTLSNSIGPEKISDSDRNFDTASDILVIEKVDPALVVISDVSLKQTEENLCDCFQESEMIKKVEIKASSSELILRCAHHVKSFQESAADSSSCGGSGRAERHQLLSTQVLENKEETMRIQSESLAVAEARISVLTTKLADMRREVDRKEMEIQSLRKTIEDNKIEKIGISIDAQTQLELVNQKNVVKTLQDNLSVIEELYRECFYETAKQEDLIEMLRKSILDIRMIERDKSNQIDKLQTVVKTQQWSLDKCQDIALEVEALKLEISNFLHGSNNDSGMWERSDASVASGVGEDLQDIMDHLLKLRNMLTGDCICGLQDENARLNEVNKNTQEEVRQLRRRLSDLEVALEEEKQSRKELKQLISLKEDELNVMKSQVSAMGATSRDQSTACDSMSVQLHQLQVMLEDKTEELRRVSQQRDCCEQTAEGLREQLQKTDSVAKENMNLRIEVSSLMKQVSQCRGELADTASRHRALRDELRRAETHILHVDDIFRARARDACVLEAELQAASAGAGRAAAALRGWLARAAALHAEQENTIKTQQTIISTLKERLKTKEKGTRRGGESEASCSKCASHRITETALGSASCYSSNDEKRRMHWASTSGSEMASCSSAPVPPKRMLRKHTCDEAAQCPARRHAATDTRSAHREHDLLDGAALAGRVHAVGAALAARRRRWARTPDA